MNTKLVKLLLAIIFSTTLVACDGSKEKRATDLETRDTTLVKLDSVRSALLDETETYTATVTPNLVNNISVNMPARIRSIKVDVGSYVRKGQILVQMDEANLSQQKTQVATLKKDFQRYQELYEVGGISKQQLDQMQTQLQVAQTSLNSLLENTQLRSPINGVITRRNFDVGDMASGMPILIIENINPVKVLVNVSEANYSDIKKGMKAKVYFDALEGRTFVGTVSLVQPIIDPASRTFGVEVSISNPKREILSGMFARVTMFLGRSEKILVKDMAVQKQMGTNERYVFVVEDGKKASYRIVKLGRRFGNQYEVLSGLKRGEEVVVEGSSRMIDGDLVKVVK